MKILYVINVDWFFISHRLPIALEAQKKGFEVHIASGITKHLKVLEDYGFKVYPLKLKRGKISIWFDIILIFQLLSIFYKVKPKILHLITIKPIIFGGILAKFFNIYALVYSIPGLGHTFIDKGFVASSRRFLIKYFYKFSLSNKNKKVILQNKYNKSVLQNFIVMKNEEIVLIPGSGVDLSVFKYKPQFNGNITFTMACRLIREKGVWEYVNAAKIVCSKHPNINFQLAGSLDLENPSSLSQEDLDFISKNTPVKLCGEISNMLGVLQKSHVVVLPSYYGEGVPKILIEAAAVGRAIITTDMPGCRDVIIDKYSGYLVPPRNIDKLVEVFEKILLKSPSFVEMGINARKLAEKKFDINHVVNTHIKIYQNF